MTTPSKSLEQLRLETRVELWIKQNPDIPYFVLRNGPCNVCGKMQFTDDNLLHWCVIEQ